MIDIENRIYTEVVLILEEKFPEISISGIEERVPSSFPHVSIVEVSNTVHTATVSSLCRENHADVMYEVDIYSNSLIDKKAEAKKILAIIDSYFISRGFRRSMSERISSNSASLFRIVARYTGCADKNNKIYRR